MKSAGGNIYTLFMLSGLLASSLPIKIMNEWMNYENLYIAH